MRRWDKPLPTSATICIIFNNNKQCTRGETVICKRFLLRYHKKKKWSFTSVTNYRAMNNVTTNMRMLIAEKRRTRALYQWTCLLSYKQNYNNLSNTPKRTLTESRTQSFKNNLANLSIKEWSHWKATKLVLQYQKYLKKINLHLRVSRHIADII